MLYGDCDGVVGSPYGPFAAALEHLVRHTDPETLRRHLGATGGELTRLLPELEARVGAFPAAAASDADTERHRLHTAVTDLLVGISSEAPLLVVLEDVHWADASTLQLLRHLVRSGAAARMLIVATFRDDDADVPEALAEALVDVYRTEGVVRIRLGGLSDDGHRRVRAAHGRGRARTRPRRRDPRPHRRQRLSRHRALARAARLRRRSTSGRHGRVLRAPPPSSARRRRCARSSTSGSCGSPPRRTRCSRSRRWPGPTSSWTPCGERRSSRADSCSTPSTRRSATGCSSRSPAVASPIASPTSSSGEPSPTGSRRRRKAEIHLLVAEALEAGRPHGDSRAVLAALAHHYAAAAPVGGVERAVDYNLLAADSAVRRARVRRGRGPLPRRARARRRASRPSGPTSCCGWGTPATGPATRMPRSTPSRVRPSSRARWAIPRCSPAPRSASSSLRGARRSTTPSRSTASRRRPRRSSEDDSELRALVLSGLARALDLRGESSRAALARDESIAMSRRRGDPRTLGATLATAYWARGSSTNEDVNRMLLEARDLGRELDDVEIESEALSWLVPSYVVLCDHDAARETVAQLSGDREAAEPAVPPPRRRALRGGARALRRRPPPRRSSAATRSAGVGPSASRAATRPGRTRSRCSASGVSRVGWPSWRRSSACSTRTRARARGAPASPRSYAELGMVDDARRELAADPRRRARGPAPVALARVARLPRRRVCGARRRRGGRGAVPGARGVLRQPTS